MSQSLRPIQTASREKYQYQDWLQQNFFSPFQIFISKKLKTGIQSNPCYMSNMNIFKNVKEKFNCFGFGDLTLTCDMSSRRHLLYIDTKYEVCVLNCILSLFKFRNNFRNLWP